MDKTKNNKALSIIIPPKGPIVSYIGLEELSKDEITEVIRGLNSVLAYRENACHA